MDRLDGNGDLALDAQEVAAAAPPDLELGPLKPVASQVRERERARARKSGRERMYACVHACMCVCFHATLRTENTAELNHKP